MTQGHQFEQFEVGKAKRIFLVMCRNAVDRGIFVLLVGPTELLKASKHGKFRGFFEAQPQHFFRYLSRRDQISLV